METKQQFQAFKDLIIRYKAAREVRMQLEAKAKEMKEKLEDALKNQILQLMLEEGLSSFKVEGLAQVVKSSKSHYEITDKEAFARTVFETLKAAEAEQRPLSDALVTQYRVSKDVFSDLYPDVEDLSNFGVTLVEKPELLIRKA